MLSYLDLLYWIKIKVVGKKINLNKPKILVANHVSYFDFFVYMKLYNYIDNHENLYAVTIDYLFHLPIIGYIFKNVNLLPIKVIRTSEEHKYNKDSVKNLYNNIFDKLSKNKSVLIFPEGRINENPKKMKKINYGAFNLSKKADIPIIIIGSKGIDKIWKKGYLPSGYGEIELKIFENEYKFTSKEEFVNTLKTKIENYLN